MEINVDSFRHKNGKSGQNVDAKVLKHKKSTKYRQKTGKADKIRTKDRQDINETNKSDLAKLELEKNVGKKLKVDGN